MEPPSPLPWPPRDGALWALTRGREGDWWRKPSQPARVGGTPLGPGQSLLFPAELLRRQGKMGLSRKEGPRRGELGHESESWPAAATPGHATCKDVGLFAVQVCGL